MQFACVSTIKTRFPHRILSFSLLCGILLGVSQALAGGVIWTSSTQDAMWNIETPPEVRHMFEQQKQDKVSALRPCKVATVFLKML